MTLTLSYLALLAAAYAEPPSQFVRSGSLQLHYLDWGGRGPVLLFLPGGCDTAFVFGDVASRLTGRFRVLALTPRGCGASDQPASGYGMDHQVADILATLDALAIDRATLVGHSSGTGKITQFALKHPARVDRLIYLDPVFRYVAPGLEEKLDAGFTRLVGGSPLDSLHHWQRTARLWELGAWSPAMDRHVAETFTVAPDGRLRHKRPTPPAWRQEVNRDMAAGHYFDTRINHPALAVFALDTDRDRAKQLDSAERELQPLIAETERRRAEEIAAFGANGRHVRIVQLRHTAHYCFVQRPKHIAQHIERFIGTFPGGPVSNRR